MEMTEVMRSTWLRAVYYLGCFAATAFVAYTVGLNSSRNGGDQTRSGLPGGDSESLSEKYRQELSMFTEMNVSCADQVPLEDVKDLIVNNVFEGVWPYSNFPRDDLQGVLKASFLHGWDSQGTVFRRLIMETKPQVILELGTFLGASTIHMATVSRELGLKPLILCADDFRGWISQEKRVRKIPRLGGFSLLLDQFMQNVVASGFNDTILPLAFSTLHSIPSLCSFGVSADLIEVDAGHTFLGAWIDINNAYALLSPKGVMFGHDINKWGVSHAVKLFAERKGLEVEKDGKHWILRKT